jgi:peptide/nickel transport system permease protein
MEEKINVNVEPRGQRFKKQLRKLFKNKLTLLGFLLVLLIVVGGILAPVIAPYPESITGQINFERMHQPPSAEFLFGTDDIGRDIFSRVLFGARYSLLMGVVVLSISILIGVPLGLIAGFWGGKVNAVIMRITDIFLAVPSIIMAMAVSAILEPSLVNTMVAVSFSWWPWLTRLVQAETLKIKSEQFVTAATGMGASKWRIAFNEILPNCLATIIVKSTTDMGFVILTGASLGFLGLGAKPPTPEWGTMVAEGRVYLPNMWWESIFPGLAVLATVLGFNLFGDGLRDLFDVHVD